MPELGDEVEGVDEAAGLAAGAFDSVFDSAFPAPSDGLVLVDSDAFSGAFSEAFSEPFFDDEYRSEYQPPPLRIKFVPPLIRR